MNFIHRWLRLNIVFLLALSLISCNGQEEGKKANNSATQSATTKTKTIPVKKQLKNNNGTKAAEKTAAKSQPQPCKLSIGWASWEPYQYKGRDGVVTGMDIDIINAALKHTNCEVTYVEGDWGNLLSQLQKGTLNAVASATLTDKRRSYAYFSEPYRVETFAIYVKNKNREMFSGKSLKSMMEAGMRLGAVMDYFYGVTLNDLQDDERYSRQFVYNDFSEANFALLFDDKVEGVLEDPYVGADLIRRRGWNEKLSKLPLVIHSGDVHLMFSKKSVSKDTVELMNNALAKIKADGTFRRLIEHYGG